MSKIINQTLLALLVACSVNSAQAEKAELPPVEPKVVAESAVPQSIADLIPAARTIVATAEMQKSTVIPKGGQLDTSAYEGLLNELNLDDMQKKVWQGLLLSYELKSMEWPFYNNILGTLETSIRERDAVLAKLDSMPPEIKANQSIQVTMVLPRTFAVEAFEKFYATLSPEKIAKYEAHIYKMIAAQGALPESNEEKK